MKNKILIIGFVIFIVLSFVYAMNYDEIPEKKYSEIKDKLDIVSLQLKESVDIKLSGRKYKLKLLDIIKHDLCIEEPEDPNWPSCVWTGEYEVSFSINNIKFSLDSGFNPSHPIITTDFRTSYIIYYIPDYNEKEARFYIEEDVTYEKERNLIIGNYLVYLDKNNKAVGIKSFNDEDENIEEQYIGKNIETIKKMIIGENIDLNEKAANQG